MRLSKLSLQHKLTVIHAGLASIAVLLIGALVRMTGWSALARLDQGLGWLAVAVLAGLIGWPLGAWASRHFTRRLQRTLETSRAWLRGNLALRIADPVPDDLGALAGQLDLLAEHLEQDEQDLDELQERNARLTDQVRALAVVEERDRLARELHDSVKQHLFSVAMMASAVRTRIEGLRDVPQDLDEMAREIEAAAKTAQREMTRLIEDLRAGLLQEQGLAAALNDYTLLLGAREHLLIYLDVKGDDGILPPSMAEALYRVAQEALHNVVRHARATRVDVQLRCIPEHVSLTVRDNGVGFDASQARRGMGLTNMQERMLAIDGRLEVHSQVGAGTTVRAKVGLTYPLSPPETLPGRDKGCPEPMIENWNWLGQKLVIPVGQTWPWRLADQLHLRRPLVEPDEGPLRFERQARWLGLRTDYWLQSKSDAPLMRVHRVKGGYEWDFEGAAWALCQVGDLRGKMVLTRNGQAMAAMQYQGRLVHAWTEIVYDGRGYRLSADETAPTRYLLMDQVGDVVLTVDVGGALRVTLHRALPLPLLIMVVGRVVDERAAVDAGRRTT